MPPTAATFYLHRVFHTAESDVVTIAVVAANGPFAGQIKDLYTTQGALAAHLEAMKDPTPDAWGGGDAQVIVEAAAQLDKLGAVLIDRPPKEEVPSTDVVRKLDTRPEMVLEALGEVAGAAAVAGEHDGVEKP